MAETGDRPRPGSERPEPLRFRSVLARIGAGYRHDWKLLLGAGLLVFGLVGLITSFDPLNGNTIDEWDGSRSIAFILVIIVQATIPLLGAVFYSGVVAAGEERRVHGVRHGLRDVARNLPYKSLIVADVAWLFVVAAGFVAVIVPGFIFIVWFSLIAPVIEMERLGPRAAFSRSRRMIRPYFWRVAGVVIPLFFLQSLLENTGEQAGHDLLGENYLGNLVGWIVANLLGAPLYALTVLALYFEIRAREDRREA